MKKRFILGFILAAFLFGGITYAAEELIVKPNTFPVYIDGAETTVEAYNINGFTYLKLADVSKTGLGVKFNETLRRIEVTSYPIQQLSKGVTSMNNAPAVEEVKPVPLNKYNMPDFSMYSGRPKIEDDGVNRYFTYNDVRYISIRSQKGRPPIVSEPYHLSNLSLDGNGNRKAQLFRRDKDKDVVLIDEIPYAVYGSDVDYYIPYDYYLNTFLPLIKG